MTRLPDLTWRPAYAYLPGQTERHPENLIDERKNANTAVFGFDVLLRVS